MNYPTRGGAFLIPGKAQEEWGERTPDGGVTPGAMAATQERQGGLPWCQGGTHEEGKGTRGRDGGIPDGGRHPGGLGGHPGKTGRAPAVPGRHTRREKVSGVRPVTISKVTGAQTRGREKGPGHSQVPGPKRGCVGRDP